MFIIIFLVFIIIGGGYNEQTNIEKGPFNICYEEIGCLVFSPNWFNPKFRPMNFRPLERHTIRTEFVLMRKNDGYNKTSIPLIYDILMPKKDALLAAGFKPGIHTIFIIHDFTSNGYTGWIKHLVSIIHSKIICNLISIDWQGGAEPPFLQAISNARVVALEAINFINFLKANFQIITEQIHIIGHGVGAHIAGYIGETIPHIYKITGLNPTGPYFEYMSKEVTLDPSDAQFVEVLHTDNSGSKSQGYKGSIGHIDFYINNALHQPGCNDTSNYPSILELHRDSIREGQILPACSHKRSFKYYISAISNHFNCTYIGIKCTSYDDFAMGKCNDCSEPGSCATFGLNTKKSNGSFNNFYMNTHSSIPYCLVAYSVNITVLTNGNIKELEGSFEFIIVDKNNRITNISSILYGNESRRFLSGAKQQFIFYGLPPVVDIIKEAKVKWIYKSRKICVLCDKSIRVERIDIKLLSITENNKIVVNHICPKYGRYALKHNDYIQFDTCKIYNENLTITPLLIMNTTTTVNPTINSTINNISTVTTNNISPLTTNSISTLAPNNISIMTTNNILTMTSFATTAQTFSTLPTNPSTVTSTKITTHTSTLLSKIERLPSTKPNNTPAKSQSSIPMKMLVTNRKYVNNFTQKVVVNKTENIFHIKEKSNNTSPNKTHDICGMEIKNRKNPRRNNNLASQNRKALKNTSIFEITLPVMDFNVRDKENEDLSVPEFVDETSLITIEPNTDEENTHYLITRKYREITEQSDEEILKEFSTCVDNSKITTTTPPDCTPPITNSEN